MSKHKGEQGCDQLHKDDRHGVFNPEAAFEAQRDQAESNAKPRKLIPYDGVANKAQFEAECKHAELAALCTACHINWVDSDNGFDTCAQCLRAQ